MPGGSSRPWRGYVDKGIAVLICPPNSYSSEIPGTCGPSYGWHIHINEGLDDEKACAHHLQCGGFRNGVVCSGLVGAMIDEGVPEEEANLYGEGIRRGGSLVAARLDDDRVARAQSILQAHAVNADERRASYVEEGGSWKCTGFPIDCRNPHLGCARTPIAARRQLSALRQENRKEGGEPFRL